MVGGEANNCHSAAGSDSTTHSDRTTHCQAMCCGRLAPSMATAGQSVVMAAAKCSDWRQSPASTRPPAQKPVRLAPPPPLPTTQLPSTRRPIALFARSPYAPARAKISGRHQHAAQPSAVVSGIGVKFWAVGIIGTLCLLARRGNVAKKQRPEWPAIVEASPPDIKASAAHFRIFRLAARAKCVKKSPVAFAPRPIARHVSLGRHASTRRGNHPTCNAKPVFAPEGYNWLCLQAKLPRLSARFPVGAFSPSWPRERVPPITSRLRFHTQERESRAKDAIGVDARHGFGRRGPSL